MTEALPVENRLLLRELSPRQAAALLAAVDAGYYATPRQATTADLARGLGLSASTVKEHLQRGEAAVMEAVAPFLRARAGTDVAAEETYAAFSRELGVWVVLRLRSDRITALRLEQHAPPRAGRRHPFLSQVLGHLRDGRRLDDLPLALEGTGFSAEVLQALREVPAGTTVTYAQLARRLGKPGAARAVGNACAGNPFLLVIPCHRVVPAAGGVGNYAGAGGARTKRRLLDREAARSSA